MNRFEFEKSSSSLEILNKENKSYFPFFKSLKSFFLICENLSKRCIFKSLQIGEFGKITIYKLDMV